MSETPVPDAPGAHSISASALAAAAATMLAERGLASTSARAVADGLGIRPSAVNYWFGGREGLVKAALSHAATEDAAFLDRLARQLGPVDGGDTLASILAAATRQLARGGATGVRLRWRLAAERDASDPSGALPALQDGLLRLCGELPGLSCREQEVLHAVAAVLDGLARGALVCASSARFDLLIDDVCVRLADRLVRRTPSRPGDSAARQLLAGRADAAPPPAIGSESRDRIIAAAVDILLESGPAGLTHRAIASRAGVSLSSTTYHFQSLTEIAESAYRALYAAARGQSSAIVDAPAGLRLEDISGRLRADASAYRQPEYAAMQQLMLAALSEPALRPFANDAFAHMGDGSTRILVALDDRLQDLDRLDGFIWRHITAGFVERSVPMGVAGAAWLESTVRIATSALFCRPASTRN